MRPSKIASLGRVMQPLVVVFLAAAYPYVRIRGESARLAIDAGVMPFDWSSFLAWTVASAAAGVVVIVVFRAVGVPAKRGSVVSALTLVVFFSWPGFVSIGDAVGVAAAAWMVFLLLLFLAWRVSESPHSYWLLGVALVGLISYSAFGFLSQRLQDPGLLTVEIEGPGSPARSPSGRDVFFVILDGYPSENVLRDNVGIDNSEFLQRLARDAFTVVPGATSAYASTVFSVGSVHALAPVSGDGALTRADRLAVIDLLGGDSPLFEAFRMAGYSTTFVANAWSLAPCGETVDQCLSPVRADEYDWALLQATPLPQFKDSFEIHPWISGAVSQVEAVLDAALSDPGGKPRFVFTHLLVPHPPLHLDEHCETRSGPVYDGYYSTSEGVSIEDRKQAFGEQLDCVGDLVWSLIRDLPEDAVVLFAADHGTAFQRQLTRPPEAWTGDDVAERFGVLLAARFPQECAADWATIGDTVNAARWLVSCAAGFDLEPVDVQSRLVTWLVGGGVRIDVPGPRT